ncbi:hypothetical protein FRC02_001987 [Tulasnella sp. 418]|nr:hypothetical protein FRC02_001987 [Tulasnella sp. 418]
MEQPSATGNENEGWESAIAEFFQSATEPESTRDGEIRERTEGTTNASIDVVEADEVGGGNHTFTLSRRLRMKQPDTGGLDQQDLLQLNISLGIRYDIWEAYIRQHNNEGKTKRAWLRTMWRKWMVAIRVEDDCDALVRKGVDAIVRYKKGDTGYLMRAIHYFRHALTVIPRDSSYQHLSLSIVANLGAALHDLYEHTKDQEKLEEAIVCNWMALIVLPEYLPERFSLLWNMGQSLQARYSYDGNIEDLKAAIIFYKGALLLYQEGDGSRCDVLRALARVLIMQFQVEGDLADLNLAIDHLRNAMMVSSEGNTPHSGVVIELVKGLVHRFLKERGWADLEESLGHCRRLRQIDSSSDGSKRGKQLNTLILLLRALFMDQGNLEVLTELIGCYQDLLSLLQGDDPNRLDYLSGFSYHLHYLFTLQGDIKSLYHSIKLQREVLRYCLPGSCIQGIALTRLANALTSRFHMEGNLQDLDDALQYHTEAHHASIAQSGDSSLPLHNIAVTLSIRFTEMKDSNDLQKAINCQREALSIGRQEEIDRSRSLTSLGGLLYQQFMLTDKLDDLEQAHDLSREAIVLLPKQHPHFPWALGSLSNILLSLAKVEEDSDTLALSIKGYGLALHAAPRDDPLFGDILHNLGVAYTASVIQFHQVKHVDRACKFLRASSKHSTAALQHRFEYSCTWAHFAHILHHHTRLEAYQQCILLLHRFLFVRPAIPSRHRTLSRALRPSLICDAASCAIDADQSQKAVEFLEQGRTVLWSHLNQYRTPLEDLGNVSPDLAKQLDHLGKRLERSAVLVGPQGDTFTMRDEAAERHRRWIKKWNYVLHKIRKLPGFERFLDTIPFDVLQGAAENGPIVILNISNFRSDAIIIQQAQDTVPLIVPLPETSPRHIERLYAEFSNALAADQEQIRGKKVISLLRLLWSDIVEPVVHSLLGSGVPVGSRVWWCPTSKLSMLPIHAAGPYRQKKSNLPDIFISSYIPTLSTLLKLKLIRNQVDPTQHRDLYPRVPKMLLVAQPTAPGHPEIKCALEEIDVIRRINPSVEVLQGRENDHNTVQSKIRTHNWVHFACHGTQRLNQPFDSCFQLHDKPLTVLEIIKDQLPEAEFAFLGACHGAAGDPHTPDEIIHLASALQFSGFRSVIGTLWQMADIDGPIVAEEVYKFLFRRVGSADGDNGVVDYRDTAEALNRATKVLVRKGVPVDRWINFVHIGA